MATNTVLTSGKSPAKAGASSEVSIQDELLIQIVPRGYAAWCGTAVQLVAEGLLPPKFAWPAKGSASWEQGAYWYSLKRCRPAGVTPKEWRESERDHWRLSRSLHAPDGRLADYARLYSEQQARRMVQWFLTPDSLPHQQKLRRAVEDNRFQTFLSSVGAIPARYSIR